jgi:hypothetical protein
VVHWQHIRRTYGDSPRHRIVIDDVLLYLMRKLGSWSLLTWDKYMDDNSLSFYISIANLLMIEEIDDGE